MSHMTKLENHVVQRCDTLVENRHAPKVRGACGLAASRMGSERLFGQQTIKIKKKSLCDLLL